MEKFVTENFVLLEFLIEDLNLENSEGIGNEIIKGDTVLIFHVLDNEPMIVTEQDFPSKSCKNTQENQVKNYKSCLLSLSPLELEEALVNFVINVDVSKKLQHGDVLQMGKAVVPIAEHFRQLIEDYNKHQEQSNVKLLEKDVRIIGLSGLCIGFITICIRLTTLKKHLMTRLINRMDDLIKGDCDYKQKSISELGGLIPTHVVQCNYVFCPACPLGCTSCNPETTTTTPPPSTSNPGNQFREVGASMGNNAVTIRVRKEPKNDLNVFCNDNEECEYKNEPNYEFQPIPGYDAGCICTKQSDDPNKEKIVLKLGKKKDGSCQKESDLEVEICCPKGKPIKPNPTTQDRETQFAVLDFPQGYLETFYGKEKWAQMRAEQSAIDAKFIKVFGPKLMHPEDYQDDKPKGKASAAGGKEKKGSKAKPAKGKKK